MTITISMFGGLRRIQELLEANNPEVERGTDIFSASSGGIECEVISLAEAWRRMEALGPLTQSQTVRKGNGMWPGWVPPAFYVVGDMKAVS